jgi:hypothetical protein
MTSLGDGRKA